MFFSDEPGYYKDGEYGIRLETIMRTVRKVFEDNPEESKFCACSLDVHFVEQAPLIFQLAFSLWSQ